MSVSNSNLSFIGCTALATIYVWVCVLHFCGNENSLTLSIKFVCTSCRPYLHNWTLRINQRLSKLGYDWLRYNGKCCTDVIIVLGYNYSTGSILLWQVVNHWLLLVFKADERLFLTRLIREFGSLPTSILCLRENHHTHMHSQWVWSLA